MSPVLQAEIGFKSQNNAGTELTRHAEVRGASSEEQAYVRTTSRLDLFKRLVF